MPKLGVDSATEDVAKTRRDNVTFSNRIMAAQLDIWETFRLTKPTSTGDRRIETTSNPLRFPIRRLYLSW
jgi:hypothetical protein